MKKETFYLLPFIKIFFLNLLELWKLWCLIVCLLVALCFALFLVESNVTETKVKTAFDAIYVTLIAFTTIGFGDVHPITVIGRILSILAGCLGIVVFGVIVWVTVQTLNNKEVIVITKIEG